MLMSSIGHCILSTDEHLFIAGAADSRNNWGPTHNHLPLQAPLTVLVFGKIIMISVLILMKNFTSDINGNIYISDINLSGLNQDLSDEARQWALPSAGGKILELFENIWEKKLFENILREKKLFERKTFREHFERKNFSRTFWEKKLFDNILREKTFW